MDVYLKEIYSKPVKCMSCIVKIIIFIHTYSTLVYSVFFYRCFNIVECFAVQKAKK